MTALLFVGIFIVGAIALLAPLLDAPPRNRFDGDNMGGNDGDLKPYDQLTRAEHDQLGEWAAIDLRGDE